MRVTSFVVAVLFLFPIPTFAQSWFEYVNHDEQVSVNFPGPPEISDHSYLSPTGSSLPARRFEAMEGESRYSVTVVNFGGSPQEDYSAAIQHAADQYRDVSGTVTYDDRGGVDGHEGQMVQLTNEEGFDLTSLRTRVASSSVRPSRAGATGITPDLDTGRCQDRCRLTVDHHAASEAA